MLKMAAATHSFGSIPSSSSPHGVAAVELTTPDNADFTSNAVVLPVGRSGVKPESRILLCFAGGNKPALACSPTWSGSGVIRLLHNVVAGLGYPRSQASSSALSRAER